MKKRKSILERKEPTLEVNNFITHAVKLRP